MYSPKYSDKDRNRMGAFKLPVSYVVYDLETSGFFDEGGEIVEFGAVKVEDGFITSEFSELCALDGTMNPDANKVNGITDDMLVGRRPLPDVFSDFVSFVDGLPLIGYNSSFFDDLFVNREAVRTGIGSPVNECARDIKADLHGTKDENKLKRYSLRTDCLEYGIVNDEAHRALSDSRASQELFEAMRIEWKDNSTDYRDIDLAPIGTELAGEVLCFTGSTDTYPKRKCMEVARAHGAELTNSVNQNDTAINKKATLLVCLVDYETDATKSAKEYGIRVAKAEEFLGMVGLTATEVANYHPDIATAKDVAFSGKSFSFANGLMTLDSFEGYQIVQERGGIPIRINSNSVKANTNFFVVTDDVAYGVKPAGYVDKAKSKGAKIVPESVFRNAAGMPLDSEGIADHWVVVDDSLEEGKVDVSNKPAWDGTVAPYKLFIQHGSVKSTHAGGWKVIACGSLSGEEDFKENVGTITRLPDGTVVTDTLNKEAVPWAEWRNDIGKVVINDRFKPTSCAYLFDGLQRCAEFDLTGLDTSAAISMRAMFRGCSSIDYFMTTDRFDTSLVTDMWCMFFGCLSARVINCIGWDLSKVKSMVMMFENSPAAVLLDEKNLPLPEGIDTARMFDTTPKEGRWLRRV